MHYYVYILECADDSFYTGITTDVARRLQEHIQGDGGHYTRSHGARKIVYSEKHPSRGTAQKREAQIKKLSRNKKLDLLKIISL